MLFRSTLHACGLEAPPKNYLAMSGFSGGVSMEGLCGALIGSVMALGYLIGFSGMLFNPASWVGSEDGQGIAAALADCGIPICEVHQLQRGFLLPGA